MNNNKLQTLIELKKLYKDKLKSEFTLECQKLGIEHRTTKPKHPWTNGQVEVFNRFVKDNTVNKYKYISKEQLVTHLDNLLIAYNFAKRLVSLKYITPYQKMLEIYNNKDLNKKGMIAMKKILSTLLFTVIIQQSSFASTHWTNDLREKFLAKEEFFYYTINI